MRASSASSARRFFPNLTHFQIREAIDSGVELIKVVIYYFLLVSLLDSFSRIRSFLLWLCFYVVVLLSLGLLHYYEIVSIPALEAYHERQWELEDEDTDQPIVLARLQCTGIYNNPNDLSRILIVGILISLYFMGDGRFGMFRACGCCQFFFLVTGSTSRSPEGDSCPC